MLGEFPDSGAGRLEWGTLEGLQSARSLLWVSEQPRDPE